jgi:hypothetical protein
MIIKYPTGLYKNILPSKPADGGNVTYTISTTAPPRVGLSIPKLFAGVMYRQRHPLPETPEERRKNLGQLLFTTSKASQTISGTATKAYEVGQVYDFEDVPTQTVEPMLVQPVSTIRHDTNLFDYTSLGLNSADVQTIESHSTKILDDLSSQLNAAKKARANAEQTIIVQQKIVNEANKTIKSLQTLVENGADVSALIEKVQSTLLTATQKIETAIALADAQAAVATIIMDKIRAISNVVR